MYLRPWGFRLLIFRWKTKILQDLSFPPSVKTVIADFFQNGGYYFAISDYVDLLAVGDYYTNGSYGLRFESNYAWRYKFRGGIGVRYENLVNSERGFPDYAQSSVYNIQWSHQQDPKSNPNSRFSASVNLGSSRYYRQSVNQLNTGNFLNNTLSSSVSYSRTFEGDPQVNINLAATHSQNTNTQEINMTLPNFTASISRIFPFAPKPVLKKEFFTISTCSTMLRLKTESPLPILFFQK